MRHRTAALRGLLVAGTVACTDAPTRPLSTPLDPTLPVVPTDTARASRSVDQSASRLARVGTESAPAAVEIVSVTDLGVPEGTTDSRAADVNNAGQVVGVSTTSAGESRAFLWAQSAGIAPLSASTDRLSSAVAINDSGQVVGQRSGRGAFLWTPRRGITDLGPFTARDINDAGQVVGSTFGEAVRWAPGRGVMGLGTLRGVASEAHAINDEGRVVGEDWIDEGVEGEGSPRALLWEPDGRLIDLPTLPAALELSSATDVNSSGQIAGWSLVAVGVRHAALWDLRNDIRDLGTLPAGERSEAAGLNDAGHVVGVSPTTLRFPDGATQEVPNAFLWTSVSGMIALGGLPGSIGSDASALNDAGQIVGTSYFRRGDFDFRARATLWTVRVTGGAGAPVVDRALAGVLLPDLYPAHAPNGGVWLRVRLTDPDADAGPDVRWRWAIDWGDGVRHAPSVGLEGAFAFVRATPYPAPGMYTITVSATDPDGLTSAAVTTSVTVP